MSEGVPPRVAVVGLGLMGGSLARDLAARGAEVRGHDRDPEVVAAARAAGILAAALPPSLEGIEEVDLLVVAVPVDAAAAVLRAAAPRLGAGCVATDLGSTKASLAAAAERLGLGGRFVGSHPFAGDHRAGWEAARPGLFAGARVFVCPGESAEARAVEAVLALWRALGAHPERLPPAEHDRRMAWASHLPQAAASALARVLAAAGVPRAELGPGGRDTTRLAASSPEVWAAIAADNAAHLAPAAEALRAELDGLIGALRAGDAAALRAFYDAGRVWSDTGGGPP